MPELKECLRAKYTEKLTKGEVIFFLSVFPWGFKQRNMLMARLTKYSTGDLRTSKTGTLLFSVRCVKS